MDGDLPRSRNFTQIIKNYFKDIRSCFPEKPVKREIRISDEEKRSLWKFFLTDQIRAKAREENQNEFPQYLTHLAETHRTTPKNIMRVAGFSQENIARV